MKNTPSTAGVFVNQHLDAYLQGLDERGFSPKTQQIYRFGVERFVEFLNYENGSEDLQSVDRERIRRYRLYLLSQQYKPASLEIFLRALKGFFAYLEALQFLFLNPCEGMVVQQAPRRLLPVPTEEEIRLLMEQPDTQTVLGLRDRTILEAAYGTGARLGELFSLQISDLFIDDQTIRLLGKGARERMVPLGRRAAGWAERYLKDARPLLLKGSASGALWISSRRNGRQLGYEALGVLIRQHGKSAGLKTPISPHSLRRACATHMLRRGADPIAIQHLLGHTALKHLSQYLKISLTEIKAMHERTAPGRA